MFDPRDYDGVTYESERRERDEQRELQAQEAEEEHEREMAFRETPFCVAECYDTMIHGVMCEAIAGWRRAQAIAFAMKEAA